MATFTTAGLNIPDQVLNPWLGKVKYGSAIATLSAQEPMKFGNGHSMTFDIGEAEYVGEGANKGGSTITPTTKTVKPFKFHKTVRWTDEVKWADEDHQMGVVQQILDAIARPLARALDFGVFHGINPTGGAAVTAMTEKLSQTTNVVTLAAGDKPQLNMDAADQLVLEDGFVPSDIALDPAFAAVFGSQRLPVATGQAIGPKMYPDLSYTTAISRLENHNASVSNTVGALGVAGAATKVQGFVGDFSGIRWGIQRQIGLKMIEYGDPDGNGDLQRNNQVAFRAEVVYGWGIGDLNAFAKIVTA
ncbi:phage major capsid protein [Mycobacterium sp. CBMA293]|uniref:phage major capsid protein n=1 Tax=unclassified Mycolicibacterium TaxID=2636767 RepID=UPI0012DEDD11|nr:MULTISPECIES: phage major capsid protein [unclassified Mycolicibacterium]MUL44472.1 phage major capsid protein [Mycolicibacterium sp. CBMA 360]MUL59792.1 phage major capsid protein [Mycolicibacterium sp. CBMA 335]MUL68635.1 phage major capsid protein [Mycolicibacterium sp. CBMA 311]MUL93974.1 phage major capsid protein [Mycolicibacterium sp. CBMA 230]MUM06221.1 major capsid protein [Mycolicibacterium sp. CBMA 213]